MSDNYSPLEHHLRMFLATLEGHVRLGPPRKMGQLDMDDT